MSDEEEDEDELEELDKVLKSLHDMLYQLKYFVMSIWRQINKKNKKKNTFKLFICNIHCVIMNFINYFMHIDVSKLKYIKFFYRLPKLVHW